MRSVGWHEVAMQDWLLEHSDQHFPSESPVLNVRLPLGSFLREFVGRANPHALVNQFVRAYRPGEPEQVKLFVDNAELSRPFLSVMLVTEEKNELGQLRKALRSLAAQTTRDFHLIVITNEHHDAHWVHDEFESDIPEWLRDNTFVSQGVSGDRAKSLNTAAKLLRGAYVAVIDDQDLPGPRWVQSFAELSKFADGSMLRVAEPEYDSVAADELGSKVSTTDAVSDARRVNFLTEPLHKLDSISNFAIPSAAFLELGTSFAGSSVSEMNTALVREVWSYCGLVFSPIPCTTRLAGRENVTADTGAAAVLGPNRGPFVMPFELISELLTQKEWLSSKLKEMVNEHEQLGALYEDARLKHIRLQKWPLLREFIQSTIEGHQFHQTNIQITLESQRPFLSIITRTQGRRITAMRDTLLSLAGQSSQDFELCVGTPQVRRGTICDGSQACSRIST